VKHGADINDRTGGGRGGSPLYYAQEEHEDDDDNPIIEFLESLGAQYIEPEEEL